MTTAPKLAFVDTETTGLDPAEDEMWELAVILRGADKTPGPYVWHIRPEHLWSASQQALNINGYYERFDDEIEQVRCIQSLTAAPIAVDMTREQLAAQLAGMLAGAHLVGSNPSFDAGFLERFIRAGGYAPSWHHRMYDIGSLVAGHRHDWIVGLADSARAVGIEPGMYDLHTALGDARLAETVFDAVMGEAS